MNRFPSAQRCSCPASRPLRKRLRFQRRRAEGGQGDGLRTDRRRLRAERGQGPGRADRLRGRKRRHQQGDRARGARRGHDPGRGREPLRRSLGQLLADPGAGRIHPLLPRWRRREGDADRQRQAQGRDSPQVEEAISSTATTSRRTRELVADAPFVAASSGRRRKPSTPARIPYERIEPVAESFGDLDPRIDARERRAGMAAST